MDLPSLIRPELVLPGLEVRDRSGALKAVSAWLAEKEWVPDAGTVFEKLTEREELGTTAVGHEVAIPHCKLKGIPGVLLAVVTVPGGVDFAAVDGRPVRLLFVVISPDGAPTAHLQCLAAISGWIRESGSLERVVGESDPAVIHRLLVGEPPSP